MAERLVDGDLLRRLCAVRERLSDQPDAAHALGGLARAAGVSRFHFLRVFRRAFGETPHQYLTRVRLERAKAALRRGRSVTEVCFDVGFSSLGSFSALFRRAVGVSPLDYQRQLRALVAAPPGGAAPLFVPYCFARAFAPGARQIAILEKPLGFRP